MKANEAPEKIYVQPNAHDGWFETKPSEIFVEYTRTDAFIEKATKWLKEWNAYRVCLEGRKDWFIEQFRKAMKEE